MRLIDADELYEKKHVALKEGEVLYRFTPRDIDNAETVDAVPVVRCRECKHYREIRTKRYGNLMCKCTRMGKYDIDYQVNPNDFCSYGERRNTDAE